MERYQYDANNRRIRLDEYTLTGEQKTYTVYTYDANGNRTGDQNRVPVSPVRDWQKTNNTGTWGGDWNVYTYDALNRLVREKEMDTGLTITYGYDSLGNRILEQDSRDHIRYAYNELNQLVEKEAYNRTTNYAYDRRGNRVLETSVHTQENRRTYEWDETNRLVKGTRGPDYSLYTSEYTYNGLGQRVNSTIMGPDKTVYDRDYTIDYTSPEHNDIAEYNVGRYQWQGEKKVHDLNYLYSADGRRLQVEATRYNQWSPEAVSYKLNVHEDILGSSTWYTRQENGYNANHHDYTTWGNNTKAPSYNYDPEYRATEPYFTGHPYDGSLNLYYAENRFYDPETGSWLSSDPARDGLNWYEYCGSNPVTYVDLLGLYPTAGAAGILEGPPSPPLTAGAAGILEGEPGRGISTGTGTQKINHIGYTPGYFNPLSGSKELFHKSVEKDWLNLYTRPTYAGNERTVNLPASLEGNYGKWLSHETAGKAKYHYLNWNAYDQITNEKRDASWEVTDKNFVMTEGGRYWVAVGPKVLEPDYPDTGTVQAADFKYATKLDVIVADDTGNKYYIPCIVGDIKNHTYDVDGSPDNGFYHTGRPYPNSGVSKEVDADHSVIEFIRSTTDGNAGDLNGIGLRIDSIIVYDEYKETTG